MNVREVKDRAVHPLMLIPVTHIRIKLELELSVFTRLHIRMRPFETAIGLIKEQSYE